MARRFGLYFIGVFLGLLLVVVFFGKRLDVLKAWLPQPRIKTEVLDKMSPEKLPQCFTAANAGNNFEAFVKYIENAHVDFTSLERKGDDRLYKIYEEEDGKNYIKLALNDSTCTLINVLHSGKEYSCEK